MLYEMGTKSFVAESKDETMTIIIKLDEKKKKIIRNEMKQNKTPNEHFLT